MSAPSWAAISAVVVTEAKEAVAEAAAAEAAAAEAAEAAASADKVAEAAEDLLTAYSSVPE